VPYPDVLSRPSMAARLQYTPSFPRARTCSSQKSHTPLAAWYLSLNRVTPNLRLLFWLLLPRLLPHVSLPRLVPSTHFHPSDLVLELYRSIQLDPVDPCHSSTRVTAIHHLWRLQSTTLKMKNAMQMRIQKRARHLATFRH
jgi:hypothetical protein